MIKALKLLIISWPNMQQLSRLFLAPLELHLRFRKKAVSSLLLSFSYQQSFSAVQLLSNS